MPMNLRNRLSQFRDSLGRIWVKTRQARAHVPIVMFFCSTVFLSFLLGMYSGYYKVFPFSTFHAARVAAAALLREVASTGVSSREGFIGFVDMSTRQVARDRIRILANAAATEDFIVTGGPDQFREYCPAYGCVAVRFHRDGSVVRAWPFRPEELKSNTIVSAQYDELSYDYFKNIYSSGLAELPSGDLIAVFFQTNGFPFGGGVARIAPTGHVKWFRRDYSHHWPTVADNEIMFPASQIREGPVRVAFGGVAVATLNCPRSYPADSIRVISLDGKLVTEVSVLDAIVASRYRGILIHTIDQCDPLHVNYVTPVGIELASHMPGVRPSDFLVSLRHVSAFAIISRSSGKLLRLYRGSFALQHSVQPYEGSKVIMFDNLGASSGTGPSRMLSYDLATGQEKVLYPVSQASRSIFSLHSGNIALSQDKSRAILTATTLGTAYEIRLSDGALLTQIDNLSDTANAAAYAAGPGHSRVARFEAFGVYYGIGSR